MEGLLGCAVLAFLFMKAWSTARVDHEFAKQGKPSPRMEAKYGQAEGARRAAKYGFTDFLRDAWSDYWPRRFEAIKAARDAKAANPTEKVSWWARAKTAVDKVDAAVKAGWTSVKAGVAKVAAPIQRTPVEPDAAAPPPTVVETGDVEPGTVRFGPDGREQWTGTEWQPAPPPATPTPAVSTPAQPDQPPATEGTQPVTASTGEAVNYETTVAELEAQIREQQAHLDQCLAAEQAAEQLATAVDGMDSTYRALSDAAANTHDHLAASNLDGTTLANTGATADALPAGRVDALLDHVEQVKQVAAERRAAAEAALAATEAALAHVQATYGDAHDTVAGNLGGDSTFLGSSGHATGARSDPAAEQQFVRDLRQRGGVAEDADRGGPWSEAPATVDAGSDSGR